MTKAARYGLNPNRPYDVKEDTVNDHHILWAQLEPLLKRKKGCSGATLRKHCESNQNPGYFAYLKRNLWIKEL